MTPPTGPRAPGQDIDASLTEIERSMDLLLKATPVNAAEARTDFERGDFTIVPTLRLREAGFEPDLVRSGTDTALGSRNGLCCRGPSA